MVLKKMVAILILLELTLQSNKKFFYGFEKNGRNPYFIGINSAILLMSVIADDNNCRNPYFIGINSAILEREDICFPFDESQSLFYWN